MEKSWFSQCLGVSEGNEGIDCSINLRLLLCPGDNPMDWGGETLLLFGDLDLTPLFGEALLWSISGISSFRSLWILARGWRGFSFPNLGVPYIPEEDPPMERSEDRGGFLLLEEKGWIDELTREKVMLKDCNNITNKQSELFNVSYPQICRGVAGRAKLVFCSASFWTVFICKLLLTALFSCSASPSSNSTSVSIKVEPMSDTNLQPYTRWCISLIYVNMTQGKKI